MFEEGIGSKEVGDTKQTVNLLEIVAESVGAGEYTPKTP